MGEGITVVVGGEGGTAEGDFETCLNWCTRPDRQLPVLMLVANNRFGISTGIGITGIVEKSVADRAVPMASRPKRWMGTIPS